MKKNKNKRTVPHRVDMKKLEDAAKEAQQKVMAFYSTERVAGLCVVAAGRLAAHSRLMQKTALPQIPQFDGADPDECVMPCSAAAKVVAFMNERRPWEDEERVVYSAYRLTKVNGR